MKIKHALLGLATVFLATSCAETRNDANTSTDNSDTLDYEVTAYTQQGDTLWQVTTDDFYEGGRIGEVSETSDDGTVALEKSTGQKYFASPGTTVVAKPFNPQNR